MFARSLLLAKRIFRNENEAPRPAPPPPRFARCASSSGPPPPLSRGRIVRAIPFSQRDPRRSFINGEARIGKVRFAIHRSPLAFFFPLQRGEAERRQTQNEPPRLRARRAPYRARSSVGVPPRLLLRRTNATAQPQAALPGTRLKDGRYLSPPVPVQRASRRPVIVPPGSGLQIRPRAPHPLHLSACLRKVSLGERDFSACNWYRDKCQTLSRYK
jgi:hypothetical protein